MISQFDDVKLSYLLHKLVYQAEIDLKNVSKLPPFFQKSQLIKKLLCSQVRFARFLVVYRWMKRNPQTNENDSKSNILAKEKYIPNLLFQIKKYIQQNQRNKQQDFFNSKIQFMDQLNLKQLAKQYLIQNNIQKYIFKSLCAFIDNYETISHIQNICAIKKYMYINAHPHYQLILRIEGQGCFVVRLKFCWNKDFNFPPEYIKELISQLEPVDIRRPNELNRIDSFLYSFHVISFFGIIVKQLTENASSFNCQILREADNSVLIIFPNSFRPFNRFILRMNQKSNNIEIFSKAPLFPIPKEPIKINEVFEKLDVDTFTPMEIYNRIIDITVNFSGSALLSELRDLVYYTNVQRFWLFLKGAMRSAVFSHFRLTMKCTSNSIFSISILFDDGQKLLLTIIFQSIDGLPIFIPISKYYNLTIHNMFLDTKILFNSLFTHYIEHMDFGHIFKQHIFSLMRKFTMTEYFHCKINFSFSEHFFVEKRNATNFPNFTLRSVDTPVNLNPRTILLKRLIKFDKTPSEIDKVIVNLTITNKIFIILLEIERRLKLKGILAKRVANALYVPTVGCKFKIDLNEYWSISFEKPFIQFITNGRVIISGNKLNLRFVDSILNLIDDWSKLGNLIYLFRQNLVYINDRKVYLKPFGYHFCIMYEPFYDDFYIDCGHIHFFKILPFKYPSSKMKVMMYTEFSSFAQYLTSEEDISSYLSRSIFYQLKISQIFSSKKWKVVPSFGKYTFTLVYDNKLSMVFHKSRDDYHIYANVFMIGPSSLLLVPLSRLFKFDENKAPVVTIKMTVVDLEKVKSEIEEYDDLIQAFKLMKIDHLFYNNGKVIGKGTRFYLVQAVLDLNGIKIRSPSFPSLIVITTSIYDLIISFECKKRIYNFILAILLFDDKYIVTTLTLLKELVEPKRINNLDWEEMSKYMKINAKEATFELMIIENGEKIFMVFDDPSTESVLIQKDGREKRFDGKSFDSIYEKMNPDIPIRDQFIF